MNCSWDDAKHFLEKVQSKHVLDFDLDKIFWKIKKKTGTGKLCSGLSLYDVSLA